LVSVSLPGEGPERIYLEVLFIDLERATSRDQHDLRVVRLVPGQYVLWLRQFDLSFCSPLPFSPFEPYGKLRPDGQVLAAMRQRVEHREVAACVRVGEETGVETVDPHGDRMPGAVRAVRIRMERGRPLVPAPGAVPGKPPEQPLIGLWLVILADDLRHGARARPRFKALPARCGRLVGG